jgi:hypothetical protein
VGEMKKIITCVVVILVSVFAVNSVCGKIDPKDYPTDLNDYKLVFDARSPQYKISPRTVLEIDSNWSLLYECYFKPMPIEKLTDKYSKSQIYLLEAMELVSIDSRNMVRTIIPILNKKQIESLRKTVENNVQEVLPKIENNIVQLKKILSAKNNEDNLYPLFYHYIFGNMTRNDIFNNHQIEWPFHNNIWRGVFYIIEKTPITKVIFYNALSNSTDEFSFCFNFRPLDNSFQTKMCKIFGVDNFMDINKRAMKISKDYTKYGKVTDQKIIDQLNKYNILDKNGKLTIPVIMKSDDNDLYKVGLKFSRNMIKAFNKINIQKIKKDYMIKSDNDAYIIVYSCWEYYLHKSLTEKKIIETPKALTDPKNTPIFEFRNIMAASQLWKEIIN